MITVLALLVAPFVLGYLVLSWVVVLTVPGVASHRFRIVLGTTLAILFGWLMPLAVLPDRLQPVGVDGRVALMLLIDGGAIAGFAAVHYAVRLVGRWWPVVVHYGERR